MLDCRLRARCALENFIMGHQYFSHKFMYVDVAKRKEVTRARYLPHSFPFPSLRMEFYSVTILTEISSVWGGLTRVARPLFSYT